MSNIVGNYFRPGPLTETRALPRARARAPASPAGCLYDASSGGSCEGTG